MVSVCKIYNHSKIYSTAPSPHLLTDRNGLPMVFVRPASIVAHGVDTQLNVSGGIGERFAIVQTFQALSAWSGQQKDGKVFQLSYNMSDI